MTTRNSKDQLGKKIRATRNGPLHTPASAGRPMKPEPRVPGTTGRPAAVWFDDEDRDILGQLAVMTRSQGLKASDSLLLRALLRLGPRDERLIEQVRELMERDGRKLRHQKPVEAK
jgi:hypothetical protein